MNKAIMIIKEECCNKCTALCETCNVVGYWNFKGLGSFGSAGGSGCGSAERGKQ